MSRDYKHTKSQPETRGGRRFGNGPDDSDTNKTSWLWLTAGLILGGGAVFALSPSSNQNQPDDTATAMSAEPAAVAECPTLPEPVAIECPPLATPPTPVPEEYTFYKLLPEMEIPVLENRYNEPESPNRPAVPPQTIQPETPVEQPGSYVLQLASLKQESAANSLVARLNNLGLTPHIQKISIDDANVWHRVRIGPIANLSELNSTRDQLNQAGYKPLLLKIKNTYN